MTRCDYEDCVNRYNHACAFCILASITRQSILISHTSATPQLSLHITLPILKNSQLLPSFPFPLRTFHSLDVVQILSLSAQGKQYICDREIFRPALFISRHPRAPFRSEVPGGRPRAANAVMMMLDCACEEVGCMYIYAYRDWCEPMERVVQRRLNVLLNFAESERASAQKITGWVRDWCEATLIAFNLTCITCVYRRGFGLAEIRRNEGGCRFLGLSCGCGALWSDGLL